MMLPVVAAELPVIIRRKTLDLCNMNRKTLQKFRSGFTLVEVLVVMTIIGIMFTIGLVNYRDFSRRQTVVAAKRVLDGALRKTQSLAISGTKPAACGANDVLDGYVFTMTSAVGYTIEARCVVGAIPTDFTVDSGTVGAGVSVSPTGGGSEILFKTLAQGVVFGAGGTQLTFTVSLSQAGVVSNQLVLVTSGGQIK